MKRVATVTTIHPAKALTGKVSYLSGLAAEDAVERHYAARGLIVTARRWRGSRGEIDLIVRDGDALIFIEVKASGTHANAAEHLTPAQIARLFGAASEFMGHEPRGQDTEARFDVALVDGLGRIEIHENALVG